MGDDEDETMNNIQEGDWEFCDEFKHVSEDCKDFISRLIVYQKGYVYLQNCAAQCMLHTPLLFIMAKNAKYYLVVAWALINVWHIHG